MEWIINLYESCNWMYNGHRYVYNMRHIVQENFMQLESGILECVTWQSMGCDMVADWFHLSSLNAEDAEFKLPTRWLLFRDLERALY